MPARAVNALATLRQLRNGVVAQVTRPVQRQTRRGADDDDGGGDVFGAESSSAETSYGLQIEAP